MSGRIDCYIDIGTILRPLSELVGGDDNVAVANLGLCVHQCRFTAISPSAC